MKLTGRQLSNAVLGELKNDHRRKRSNFDLGGRAVEGDRGPNSSAEKVLECPGAAVTPTQPRAATCAVAVVGVLGDAGVPK